MKKILVILAPCYLAAMVLALPVDAWPGGCVKSAIVGGIVGHVVGMGA